VREAVELGGVGVGVGARNACRSRWASGWFWQSVPIRFHRNGTASSRSTSMPRLARASIVPSMARNTAGLA
jgi:hypothetical protein